MNVDHVCSVYTYMYLNVGTLFVNQWRRPAGQDKPVEQRLFRISRNSTIFKEYYNEIQGSLKSLAGMDDFLTGKYNIEVYDNIIYCVYVQAF